MTAKIAVKKLTATDLTFFDWYYRTENAGVSRQKSINLNADIFVTRLYPAIETATRTTGTVSLDLLVSGPGAALPINRRRKIIKSGGSKNWRLDGEVMNNPAEEPQRFNALRPGDFVVFSFEGDVVPTAASAVFVARSLPEDAALHSAFDALGFVGRNTMRALSESDLADIVTRAGLPADHPLVGLTLTEEELQEAAIGSAAARERLVRGGRMLRVSADALRRAREAAAEIGRRGEELIAVYLERQQSAAAITGFEWTSRDNAVAPMDFRISTLTAPAEAIDVKSTAGPFDREFHVSLAELKEMAAGGSLYRVYRVYEMRDTGAKLRISGDMKAIAEAVLMALRALPKEVTVDAVSMIPESAMFGAEIVLIVGDEDEEVEHDGGRADSGTAPVQHEQDQGSQHDA
jgi:Domain of unknown function (DUF3883)